MTPQRRWLATLLATAAQPLPQLPWARRPANPASAAHPTPAATAAG